jgi:hypothetical protein
MKITHSRKRSTGVTELGGNKSNLVTKDKLGNDTFIEDFEKL